MTTENKNKLQEEQSKVRPCPKDCTKCRFQQHAFCAAQMGFYTIEKLHEMHGQIIALQQEFEKLKTSEQPLELINPIENINKYAQKASGANNRLPKQSKNKKYYESERKNIR